MAKIWCGLLPYVVKAMYKIRLKYARFPKRKDKNNFFNCKIGYSTQTYKLNYAAKNFTNYNDGKTREILLKY